MYPTVMLIYHLKIYFFMVSMNRAQFMQLSGGYINDMMERQLKTSSSFEQFLFHVQYLYLFYFFFKYILCHEDMCYDCNMH